MLLSACPEIPEPRSAAGPAGVAYRPGLELAGRYRLVRMLSEGGMGVVWVAYNMVLDLHVALKIIELQAGTVSAKQVQRTLQEARAAAKLSHPAICRALDFGETERGDPFVVTELMHGETLGDLIDSRGRIPASEAVQLLLPVIDGLAVAHAHGIVHRDVKPENVFLSRDISGRLVPKILDFGIAGFVDPERKVTLDDNLLGTPRYMSPEQARGNVEADFRSDIWGVCVLLYEALTGRVPFTGANHNDILWNVVHQPPASIMQLGAGNTDLWRLLELGLRKEPEQRWQSMRELGEALALWLYERGIREDVCGASLRKSWLEAGLSDVQIEAPDSLFAPSGPEPSVYSGNAPRDSIATLPPPPRMPGLARQQAPASSRAARTSAPTVRLPARWRRPTRLAAAAALVLVSVSAGFWAGRSTGRHEPSASHSAAQRAPRAQPRAPELAEGALGAAVQEPLECAPAHPPMEATAAVLTEADQQARRALRGYGTAEGAARPTTVQAQPVHRGPRPAQPSPECKDRELGF